MFRLPFLHGLSAAALLASTRGYDEQKIRAQESLRPTPRKPERPKPHKAASARRHRIRVLNKLATAKQHRKQREIGTDPIFHNGLSRDVRERQSQAWNALSRKWDRDNAKVPV